MINIFEGTIAVFNDISMTKVCIGNKESIHIMVNRDVDFLI